MRCERTIQMRHLLLSCHKLGCVLHKLFSLNSMTLSSSQLLFPVLDAYLTICMTLLLKRASLEGQVVVLDGLLQ